MPKLKYAQVHSPHSLKLSNFSPKFILPEAPGPFPGTLADHLKPGPYGIFRTS
jgi:hypothetical protein